MAETLVDCRVYQLNHRKHTVDSTIDVKRRCCLSDENISNVCSEKSNDILHRAKRIGSVQ